MYNSVSEFSRKIREIITQASTVEDKKDRKKQISVNVLEEYLKIANGTAFGKSKQEVLNAIKGLQLTAEQSQEIRENLKNHHLNRRAHDGNVVALVVTVLQKLKNDHHSSSFFHTKPVRAYEEAKSGLQNIAARTHADVKPKGWLGSHKHHYFFLPAGSKLNKTSLAEAIQAGADIRYVDLRGEDLRGLDLSEADLEGVVLAGAKLDPAGLQRAIVCSAELSGVDLTGQDLRDTNWGLADLKGAILRGARISPADFAYLAFVGADFRGVNLSGEDLRGVDPSNTNLEGAILGDAQLDQRFFLHATRTSANVRGVNLSRQDLQRLDVRGLDIDLSGAFLVGADMREADLRNTTINLSGALMARANLDHVKMNQRVLEQVLAAGASVRRVDLSDQNLLDVHLPHGEERIIDLQGANLSGALLVGNWLRFVDLRGANCANTAAVLQFTGNPDNDLHNLNNPHGSFFSVINSIDSRHERFKRLLMTQVIDYLNDKNIDSLEDVLIDNLLNGSIDFTNSIFSYPAFKDKFLRLVVQRGNLSTLNINDNGARTLIERYLSKMMPEELKAFTVDNYKCFIQIIRRGRAAEDENLKQLSESIFQKYLQFPGV